MASDGMSLHDESFVLDLHTHAPGFLPQPFRTLWRAVTVAGPAEAGFDALRAGGVDAAVAKAVGDPAVTRCFLGRDAWAAVDDQLARIEAQAAQAGAVVVRSMEELTRARTRRTPAVLLGVEGADALADEVDRIDSWYRRGVRVIGLVHLGDNTLGTTCLPWHGYLRWLPVRRRREPGLSDFGRQAVERMNRLGVLVDVAHCDSSTVLDVTTVAKAPVVASHSGARALQDFPRYLTDHELGAIAATGGLVGLWPYRTRRTGVRDIPDLIDHARHIATTIGPEHLALGTDMNGVPRVMAGYRGEDDLPKVTCALLDAGFDAADVQGILGGNALRVLREVEKYSQA